MASTQDKTAYHAGEAKGHAEEEMREKIAKARALAAEARQKAGLTAQAARDRASENAETVKEKTSETAEAAKENAVEGKEKTGGFLQQASEKVMNVAQGTAEAVKSSLGIGVDNKDKETAAGGNNMSFQQPTGGLATGNLDTGRLIIVTGSSLKPPVIVDGLSTIAGGIRQDSGGLAAGNRFLRGLFRCTKFTLQNSSRRSRKRKQVTMSTGDKAAFHAGEAKGQTQEKTDNLFGKASNAASGAKDKTAETAQAAKDHAVEGKDNAGGFLQQTGEKVKNAAQGTTDAVKNTLGIGEENKGN
ncbi:late embryogenesis abundant protein 1 [Dendrobium catenatum]|nr:late embryogenesis abundant protein 1 [Dendrobium catenatum]